MKLTDFVIAPAIVPELKATERNDVIRELVESAVAAGAVEADLSEELIKAIIEREKKGSTGFGKGVAVPHVKHDGIKKMGAVVGVSQKGVDFNALDKQAVYSVILLLSPKDRPDQHLQAMESIFGNLQNDTFRRFLRQATTREQVVELLSDADAQQLQS